MTAEVVLRRLISDEKCDTLVKLRSRLEQLRKSSLTARLWIDCVVHATSIMLLFIRAERKANWVMHMYAVTEMLPYFFAAGHHQYARYISHYVNSMKCLPKEVHRLVMNGDTTVRHTSGKFNGIWTDMMIEQTYMKQGKGLGGMVGLTLSPEKVARWNLSLHVVSNVSRCIEDILTECSDRTEDLRHKEEHSSRISLDSVDRTKMLAALDECCIHPLDDSVSSLMNIYTGKIAEDDVNVADAVKLGKSLHQGFMSVYPEGFHSPIKKVVKTMAGKTRSLSQNSKSVPIDPERLYSRLLVISCNRKFSLSKVLEYELAPVPLKLFTLDGDMRTGNKSQLYHALAVQSQIEQKVDHVIIDGNPLLYHVRWPSSGAKVRHLVEMVVAIIDNELQHHDVDVVFDSYVDWSTKTATRKKRGQSGEHHLSLDTPLPRRDVLMRSPRDKTALINLIKGSLEEAERRHHHTLYVSGGTSSSVEESGENEEADINIVQRLLINCNLSDSAEMKHIQIRSDDTDVFVLLLCHYALSQIQAVVTLRSFMRRTPDTVDVGATCQSLGFDTCRALPAMHSLTGCDTTSYPYGVGKKRCLRILHDDMDLTRSLHSLGAPDISKELVVSISAQFFSRYVPAFNC